jgi:hypothetical protein
LARTTGRDGITAFSRMREIELHSPELPTDLNAMRLSDQISQKQCMTAIAAADARLLGPRLALPRDLIENATI